MHRIAVLVLCAFAVAACATQQPEPEPAPVAVVKPEPEPQSEAREPVTVRRTEPVLPKTASALPRLGLAGASALGVAGLLRVLRRRL